MGLLSDFSRSTLAKKAIMAVTGLILFGFVFAHMVGNLKIYGGSEKLNHYAEGLREMGAPVFGHGELLWIARFVLLAAVGLHIWSAWALTRLSHQARPVGYAVVKHQGATYASRTMRWGGVILLLFIVYHLLHLTFGVRAVHPTFDPADVYHNVVAGFQNPLASGFYILANLALGLHLYHGLWSLCQSLGWSGPRFDRVRKNFALVFALVITLANISFPVAVLAGWVK